MGTRALLLSAGFGSGHLQAARAVADALAEIDPTCLVEALNLENRLLDAASTCYLAMIKRTPGLYRELYRAPVSQRARLLIRSVLSRAVQQEIARVQPTAVVATHPFPGGTAAYLRQSGHLHAPVFMVLTDFAPHPIWIHAGVDHYFVACASAAQRLMILGVEAKRISIAGIPVRQEWAQAFPMTRAGENRRVLLMGGGLGLGPIVEGARSLAKLPHANLAVTVVCGHNQKLFRDMTERFGRDARFEIVGYVSNMTERMCHADLLVTKPGGITCSEAMAVHLPMLLLPPLPGHEEENAGYLVSAGAAEMSDAAELGQTINALLFGPGDRLARLRASARLAGRPGSARAVANEIIALSTPNRHIVATG